MKQANLGITEAVKEKKMTKEQKLKMEIKELKSNLEKVTDELDLERSKTFKEAGLEFIGKEDIFDRRVTEQLELVDKYGQFALDMMKKATSESIPSFVEFSADDFDINAPLQMIPLDVPQVLAVLEEHNLEKIFVKRGIERIYIKKDFSLYGVAVSMGYLDKKRLERIRLGFIKSRKYFAPDEKEIRKAINILADGNIEYIIHHLLAEVKNSQVVSKEDIDKVIQFGFNPQTETEFYRAKHWLYSLIISILENWANTKELQFYNKSNLSYSVHGLKITDYYTIINGITMGEVGKIEEKDLKKSDSYLSVLLSNMMIADVNEDLMFTNWYECTRFNDIEMFVGKKSTVFEEKSRAVLVSHVDNQRNIKDVMPVNGVYTLFCKPRKVRGDGINNLHSFILSLGYSNTREFFLSLWKDVLEEYMTHKVSKTPEFTDNEEKELKDKYLGYVKPNCKDSDFHDDILKNEILRLLDLRVPVSLSEFDATHQMWYLNKLITGERDDFDLKNIEFQVPISRLSSELKIAQSSIVEYLRNNGYGSIYTVTDIDKVMSELGYTKKNINYRFYIKSK